MATIQTCPSEAEQWEWKTNSQEQLGIAPLGSNSLMMEEQAWGFF